MYVYCFQGIFSLQCQEHCLYGEIKNKATSQEPASDIVEQTKDQNIHISCQTSENDHMTHKPISNNVTQTCTKPNEAVFTNENKQVIKIQVSVNATIQNDEDRNPNGNVYLERKDGLQDVTIPRASTSKLSCGKLNYTADDKTNGNEYGNQQTKIDLYTETEKCTFLSTLGLVPMSADQHPRKSSKKTLLRRFFNLSKRTAHQKKLSPCRCDDGTLRKHKGNIVDLQTFKKRVPVVKLTRMEECRTLRKKYSMQLHRMQNIVRKKSRTSTNCAK